MKISQSCHKEWLEICAMFFSQNGVEETVRNGSSSLVLFHVNNWLQFLKGASNSPPTHIGAMGGGVSDMLE